MPEYSKAPRGLFVLVYVGRVFTANAISPSMEFKKGQEVSVYIEEVDANEHKIALGLVLTTKPVAYK